MIDFLKRVDWLAVIIVICVAAMIIMLLCTIANAADNQYLKFQNFAAGLTTNQVGEVPNNACLQLENFLFDNQELRVRKGYGLAAAGFNISPIHWMGMYRRQGAAGKLFVQAGNQLYIIDRGNIDTVWTDNEYTQNFFETGTVSVGGNGSMYIRTSDSTSRFESYAFTSVDFDSGTQTTKRYSVDYAVNDTILKLKTATTGVTGWTYKFSVPLGDVVYGQTFVDTFYLATSSGALRYNDSTLSGTVTPVVVRGVPKRISKHADFDQGMNHYTMQFDSLKLDNGTWLQALYDNKQWVRVSLRAVGAATSVLSGEVYYLTLPIYALGTYTYPTYGYIRTGGGAFLYSQTANPKVSLVNVEIDPTSKLTVYADSVIFRATASGTYDTRTIIVDDSLMSGKDSTYFASGDWFVCWGTSITDDFDSKYSAVVGNYLDDSLRVYVTDCFMKQDADTIETNVPLTFFRRRIAIDASTGVNAAIFWNDRYHVVYSETPSEIEHSAQFFPSDFSDGLLTQVSPDDGEPILWLREMYGALLIGKRSSIWRLTGISGVDAFARLDKVVSGVSFVAPRSIVERSGLMFGLGRDGFYMFDFNSMVKISDQINDLVRDSINWDYASNITAAYFDGHFWVSYPSRTSIVNNRTLCYDPQNKAWSTSTLNFEGIYVDGGVDDTDNVYIGDPDTGKVYIYGNSITDAGASITAILATSWFDMGSSFLDKIVNRASITNHRSSSCSVSVSFVAKREDGIATTSSRTFSGAQDTFRGKTRIWMDTNNLRGMEYQLNLTATNAIGLRLGNVEVEYQILSAGY